MLVSLLSKFSRALWIERFSAGGLVMKALPESEKDQDVPEEVPTDAPSPGT